MPRIRGIVVPVMAGLLAAAVLVTAPSPVGAQTAASSSTYKHVFVIVEENHGYSDVIGNPAAPNLNALANQFGVATRYYGISHPSEPNYVALLGGSTFGVNSDNAYFTQEVNAPSLMTELDQAGLSWKAYLQYLPYAGYQGICYPLKCNGAPDSDPLYVSKHDAVQNFTPDLNTADWNRQVPYGQLQTDLTKGTIPAVGYIVPTECSDQHGDPPFCIDSGNPDSGNLASADPQDQRLIAQGDAFLGKTVSAITNAPFWSQGNNAIVVTYDEGDDNQGCCNAGNTNPNGTGGGQVATVVVTSHGPRGVTDGTPSNHYSLLSTIQHNFGLPCLQNSCDAGTVKPMSKLLAVTGSPSVATTAITPPNYATPTPTPTEPGSYTTSTVSSGGWQVTPAPLLGTSDNSDGAIAGSGPNDLWAVGDFLPDTASSNQDATLSLAMHYNGVTWTATPTPNSGPNFNELLSVADSGGKAWAVGVDMNAAYQSRGLIEAWNGSSWTIANNPQPGTKRDLLYGVTALSPSNVWAVGDQQGPGSEFTTLVEHFDGTSWSVVPSPNPGSAGDHLYGIAAAGPSDIWTVGQQLDGSSAKPLAEHFDGTSWTAVATPAMGNPTSALFSVAAGPAGVYAAGETDNDATGGHPLLERYTGGTWSAVALPTSAGSNWTNLWGITVAGNTAYAVGTYLDPVTGNNDALMLKGTGSTWSVANAPNPGSGSNILGGVASVGSQVWAAGLYDQGGSNLPLLEYTNQ